MEMKLYHVRMSLNGSRDSERDVRILKITKEWQWPLSVAGYPQAVANIHKLEAIDHIMTLKLMED